MGSEVPGKGLSHETDISVQDVDIAVVQKADILHEVVGEKAVRRVIEPDILFVLFDRHESDKALVDIAESIMSVEQVHIQGDIAQVPTEIDVDVLRGITVGDVAGMEEASLAEAGNLLLIVAQGEDPLQHTEHDSGTLCGKGQRAFLISNTSHTEKV